MWWLLIFPFLAGSIGAGAWMDLRNNQRRLRGWQKAAVSCGLQVTEISSGRAWRLKLAARAGPVEVLILSSRSKQYGTLLVVKVPGPPGFADVRLRRELSRTSPAREIEIGDETFDKTFSIEGPRRLVFALLGAETRRLLSDVNTESQLAIGGGELRAGTYDVDVHTILSLLLELAQRFAHPVDVVRRLSENALCDLLPGVRLRNLLLLARELPEDPRTVETLRAARSDATPEIRLRAAMELGAEGRDILVALAESTEDDACSAQALRIVGGDLPFERLRSILTEALRRRRMQTGHACLEALGRIGSAEAVETLARVMSREQSDLPVTAARALGRIGSAVAEAPLIQALAFGRERMELRIAAARALGRLGSVAAVLPLKEAAERFPDNPDLARATRQAIAEIQSRLPGASPGQLSLAGAEAGLLSLAQAEAGQLSLAGEQAGQLSLAPGEPGQLSLSGDEEGLKP